MTNKLTVICAVWHKDKDRESLLKGHMDCLDNLLIPVERIYIFDGNDKPPNWLNGEIIIAKNNLTIYEAWNVGLSRVSTPYVMNLNLDDRLHKDASEIFISELDNGADLVGGEWEVCFNQEETDSQYYSENLDFHPYWPPKFGIKTKLGSGSGERGTYGPSCAWKMQLHINLPRYPFKFSNGEKIQVIGDQLWWMLLKSMNKNLVRVERVIGKYYSHPTEQAEFRKDGNEIEIFNKCGAVLI